MRVRWLGVKGKLSSGISDSDVTITSDGLVDLPEIVAPDYAVLVLDPNSVDGRPEVIYVTDHTASADTATITRGEETVDGGSTARAHSANTVWYHAATPSDIEELDTGLSDHIGDTTAAHAASAVSFDPTGLAVVTGDDVQEVIGELDAAVDGLSGGGSGGAIDVVTVQYKNGSNYTTTSSTYTAIDDTNLQISVTLAVGDEVSLEFYAPWSIASVGNVAGLDWLVDAPSADTMIANSTGAYGCAAFEFGSNAADCDTRSAMGLWIAAEAGVHVFKPRWKVSGGTTVYLRQTGTYNGLIVHRATVKTV